MKQENLVLVAWCSLLLLLLVLMPSGCRSREREIRIGLLAMLSDPNTENGENSRDAAELAVREVNSRSGLHLGRSKRKVALIVEDDRNSPETALDAARKIIYKDNVVAFVGPQFSRNAIPVAREAESAKIVMVAPMSTHPETTAGKRYVFRVPYLDTFQGLVIARFAREELHAETAAVLYDIAGIYNQTLAEVFISTFREKGGEVVASETYTTDRNTDFSPQARRIAALKPDVLYLPNYCQDVRRQAKQARAFGSGSVFLGGDGWEDDFAEEGAFNGSFFTRHWHPSLPGGRSQAFVAAFRSAYGRVPEDVAATTYDAFGLLFAAMEKAGSDNPSAIQKAMYDLPAFEGVTGAIDYQQTGDPVKSAVIVGISQGIAAVHRVFSP